MLARLDELLTAVHAAGTIRHFGGDAIERERARAAAARVG